MQNAHLSLAVMLLAMATSNGVYGQSTVYSIPDNGLPGFGDFVADAGNIDGDEYSDFMLTLQSDANGAQISVRRGTTNEERFLLSTPPIEDLGSVGDLDADGIEDIAVLSRAPTSGSVTLWLYSGAFGVPISLPSAPPGVMVGVGLGALIERLGDINSDGYDDFAIALTGGSELLPGQTCPTFIPGVTQIYSGLDGGLIRTHGAPGGKAPCELTRLDDITGDGISEYAIGGLGQTMTPPGGGCPSVPALNSSLEIFSGATGAPLQSHPGSALLGLGVAPSADLNLDGFPDILSQSQDLSSGQPNEVLNHVMSGFDGSSIFCFHVATAGQPVFGIYTAGDIDGDYAPEFLVIDTQSIRIMSGANSDTVLTIPIDISTTARSPVAHLGSLTRDRLNDLIVTHDNPRRVTVLSPVTLPSALTHGLAQGFGRPTMIPPEFSMSPGPTLGQVVTFRYSFGTPQAIGNFLWGPPIATYYFPTGHPITLDLSGSEVLAPIILDANGEWELPFFLRNGAAIIGNEVHMQSYALSPNSPGGIEVTNGLYVRFGPAVY